MDRWNIERIEYEKNMKRCKIIYDNKIKKRKEKKKWKNVLMI